MLPEGFHWEHHIDAPALFLGDSPAPLALLAVLERGCRVCINPTLISLRYVFLRDQAEAIRYIEAWAVKWEQRIRQEYRA